MAKASVTIPFSRDMGEQEVKAETSVDIFMAFAVNMANLRKKGKSPRPKQDDLIRSWNRELSFSETEITFVDYFRHTGNYLLKIAGQCSLNHLSKILTKYVASEHFAIFHHAEFMRLIDSLNLNLHDKPEPRPGRTWTLGLVMDLNPKGDTPPLPRSNGRFVFGSFAVSRVRVAWKADVLNPNGKTLDKSRRDGGWGSLATHMRNEFGGQWTARAISSVKGLLGRAHRYETRSV